jgi:hypothetical protein
MLPAEKKNSQYGQSSETSLCASIITIKKNKPHAVAGDATDPHILVVIGTICHKL